jgi:hypothetical protein
MAHTSSSRTIESTTLSARQKLLSTEPRAIARTFPNFFYPPPRQANLCTGYPSSSGSQAPRRENCCGKEPGIWSSQSSNPPNLGCSCWKVRPAGLSFAPHGAAARPRSKRSRLSELSCRSLRQMLPSLRCNAMTLKDHRSTPSQRTRAATNPFTQTDGRQTASLPVVCRLIPSCVRTQTPRSPSIPEGAPWPST